VSQAATRSIQAYDDADDMQFEAALLSAAAITGDEVCNMQDEKLGGIQDVMLDITEGKIRHAVMVSNANPGTGDRLIVVPWRALKQDRQNKRFTLDVDVERLKNAPGFERDQWPKTADVTWHLTVEYYYAR
jgi:sporulation protein YlmC with PRC-barrel domain